MGWIAIFKDGTIKREGETFINERGEQEGVGRPVQAGDEGNLVAIAQEDFGKKIAIDLTKGSIIFNYDRLDIENGSLIIEGNGPSVFICEETNIVGDYKHISSVFEPWYNCQKTKFLEVELKNSDGSTQLNADGSLKTERREVACEDGSTRPDELCANGHRRKPVMDSNDGHHIHVRTDTEHPLIWRPIWFTRFINGIPTKIIGAQTTTPSEIDPNSGKELGKRNVKKIISLFSDGRVGID